MQEELLPKFGLKAEMKIYDPHTDTNGFIGSSNSFVVVAFRGTESWRDFFTDIKFIPKPIIPGQKPLAHSGFVNALNSVFEPIANKLEDILGHKSLYITGHSLGAALASLWRTAIHKGTWVFGQKFTFMAVLPLETRLLPTTSIGWTPTQSPSRMT